MTKLTTALLLLFVLIAPAARAQQPPPAAPGKPAAAQDEFLPVNEPINPEDAMPAPRLVAIAYAFIWVVLFGYLWSVRRRLAGVEREMATVSRRVEAARK